MAANATCSRDSVQVSISMETCSSPAAPNNKNMPSGEKTNTDCPRKLKKARKFRKLEESDFDTKPPPAVADWVEQLSFPEAVATAARASQPSAQQSSHDAPDSQPKKGRRRGKGRKMNTAKSAMSYSVPPHLRGKASSPTASSQPVHEVTAHKLNDAAWNPTPSGQSDSNPGRNMHATLSSYIPPHLRREFSHPPALNAGISNHDTSTRNNHVDAPRSAITSDPAIIAFRPKPAKLAMSSKASAKDGIATSHQQKSPEKVSSSSGPLTGTANNPAPNYPPSPPSSPINGENEEHNSGTLDDWRGASKDPMHDTSKGVQQSQWSIVGPGWKKRIVPDPYATNAEPQPDDYGWAESCRTMSKQPKQPQAIKKTSKNPNSNWNDSWDPKQAHQIKGANGWPKRGKTHWPKNSDMKAQPIEDQSDGGVSFKSNSNGDPNYDVKKLVDWSGNWMPPPEVWTGRNTFRDRHFGDSMEGWMERSEKCGTSKLIMDINPADFLAEVGHDLVPRDWIPSQIERDSPQQFWRSLPSRAPAPVDERDMDELKPWWELYADPTTEYLFPFKVPDALVDPEDAENEKRFMPSTSQDAVNRAKDKKEADYRKIMARRNRPVVISKLKFDPPPLDLSLKPVANIYLRPAQPADIPQLTDLYNHYVGETICANEFNSRTHAHMADRLQNIITGGLPWIVAVKKGNHSKNQHYKFVNEEIVGFADMDDHCDEGSMYRYTMEMEMFVHPEYLRQGVGKCLLDRMLELVDNGYKARNGYEWICNGTYLKSGPARVVKTVNLHFLHEHGVTSEVNWVAAFLKSFKFRKSGHLYNMGYKLGKIVDLTIFQYTTSEPVDAQARPHVPL